MVLSTLKRKETPHRPRTARHKSLTSLGSQPLNKAISLSLSSRRRTLPPGRCRLLSPGWHPEQQKLAHRPHVIRDSCRHTCTCGAGKSVAGDPQLVGAISNCRVGQPRTSSEIQYTLVGHHSGFAPRTRLVREVRQMRCIRLERIEPETNKYRFYLLSDVAQRCAGASAR